MRLKLFENFNQLDYQSLYNQAPQKLKDILDSLESVEQRPDFHPEIFCDIHTKTVVNRLAKHNDINLSLAGIFHDIGKKDTGKVNPKTGHQQHPGHEFASLRYVEEFKNWIEKMGGDYQTIFNIIKNHMRMKQLNQMGDVKKQRMYDLPEYPLLVKFSEADHGGTDV